MAGRIITVDHEAREVAKSAKRVAVLGIKIEKLASEPAYYVPEYLVYAGVEVIPVPVYFPEVREILGAPVFRKVSDIPSRVDIVDVFRRSQDLAPHLDDLIAARPYCVWLQSGIRNDLFARKLADAGIDVVQDRCLMVDHRLATTRV